MSRPIQPGDVVRCYHVLTRLGNVLQMSIRWKRSMGPHGNSPNRVKTPQLPCK